MRNNGCQEMVKRDSGRGSEGLAHVQVYDNIKSVGTLKKLIAILPPNMKVEYCFRMTQLKILLDNSILSYLNVSRNK